MNTAKFDQFSSDKKIIIGEVHAAAEALRRDSKEPIDVDFDDLLKSSDIGLGIDDLLMELGINPAVDSITAIHTTNDMNVRFLMPEIIRKAIRVGLRSALIWPSITAINVS